MQRIEKLSIPEHLKMLRDTFSDEIPPKIIHSPDLDNRYKVRRNWWVGLLATLKIGLEDGIFPDLKLQEEITKFLEYYYHRPNFFDKPLTTVEDIQQANRLINLIIGEKTTTEENVSN